VARRLKYEQVKEALRKRFRTDYAVGEKVPSTLQLHKDLRVSPQTVNRAVSDLVEEGLLVREPRRGTFVTRPKSATRNIGFVCPKPLENPNVGDSTWEPEDPPYPPEVLHGAEAAARQRDRHVLIALSNDPRRPAFTGGRTHVAGAIITFNRHPEMIEAYHARGIPVVLVEPHVRTGGVPFVACDHYSGMREAVLYLVRLGHRRIVHVTVEFTMSVLFLEEQVLGYQAAMRESGLGEFIRVHRVPFGLPPRLADPEFVHMLEEVRPTACSCCSDAGVAGVMRICHAQHIRVPDELSLVGVDFRGIADQLTPRMTTVKTPHAELGRTAVRLLEDLIESDRFDGDGVIIPAPLVVRDSAKPLPQRS